MGKPYGVLVVMLFFLLCGCTVKIVPSPEGGAIAGPDGKSLSVSSDRLTVTVRHVEPEILTTIEGGVCAFFVEMANNGENVFVADPDGFILVDAGNRQYFSMSPDKVRQLLARDTFYLLPYPYVGFYYTEDYARAEYKNATATSLPYYYEYRPQELFTEALPAGSVIPGAKISGLVYFSADLASLPSFRLLFYPPGRGKNSATDFVFPFKVLK